MRLSLALALIAQFNVTVRCEEPPAAHSGSNPPIAGRLNGQTPAERFSRSGVVVDEEGKPLEGIAVTGYSFDAEHDTAAITDAQGRFTVRWKTPIGVAHFFMARDDHGRQGAFHWPLSDLGGRTPICIVLKPAGRWTMHVVDSNDKPVENAVVAFFAGARVARWGQTDKAGKWAAELPLDAEVGAAVALKSGLGFDYVATSPARPETPRESVPKSIELKLDGARTVDIMAVDTFGRPLSGIPVAPISIRLRGRKNSITFATNWEGATVLTNQAGVATFDWLPKIAEQPIWFSSNFAENAAYHPRKRVTLSAQGQALSSPQLVVKRSACVSGRVIFSDAQPAKGIEVRALGTSENGRAGGRVLTQDDGSYEMLLPSEASYVLSVNDDHFAAPSYIGPVLAEGKETDHIDFSLAPGTIVRGKITVGEDQRPLANALASLRMRGGLAPSFLFEKNAPPHGLEITREAITGADGSFRFCVSSGAYQLVAFARTSPIFRPIEVQVRDQPEIVHDFDLPRGLSKPMYGQVIDDGMPARVEVTGTPKHNQLVLGAMSGGTSSGSRFVFAGELIPLVLYARSMDGARAGALRVEKEQPEYKITLSQATRIRGRLLDHNGDVLAGARVHFAVIYDESDARLRGSIVDSNQNWAESGADGAFELRGFVPGEAYVLEVERGPESNHWSRLTIVRPGERDLELGDMRVPAP